MAGEHVLGQYGVDAGYIELQNFLAGIPIHVVYLIVLYRIMNTKSLKRSMDTTSMSRCKLQVE